MATKKEYSYGIVPLAQLEDGWYVLLVQAYAGHWGFPKGHPDPRETAWEAAQRELFEETGLKVCKLLSDQTFEESFYFKFEGVLIHKTVSYYIAQVEGEVQRMEEEIKAVQWVPLNQAADYITFDQGKNICRQVVQVVAEI
ncbi:NUDIX domain-containing protein [Neochlamydia sp. AcF95]|uniref:bis(5'-nucleosyl)-tetraphosphatase n=1 Tax=Neochlamydia sp. AcF95 TaxID=2795734 RepID=UPI001BC8E10D|nr:NUDIX domain-containing protein [Neochlamydia sp. AcF95]MBS4169953.1 Diadenosine hexaphosphate hydrolase [Neochlamydia sp. AcF95]